eukprot:TRINITY_DN594_c0_g1_i9.p1 TRINITY_DN594_c0_g1~~TRINITY_DN594_c0_g1_i9.p1  ORF type:complete len:107 (-),score=15.42 TRINITY_DN594_c0_g1_i9:292-612(-)
MISKAEKWYSEDNPSHLHFLTLDMRDYTPEQPFDVVFAMASLYYISPMETLSHKIREWVKPGSFSISPQFLHHPTHTSILVLQVVFLLSEQTFTWIVQRVQNGLIY